MLYDADQKGGLPTHSGKVDIYSETLEKLGYDPLPTHREPPESLVSTPELAKECPLVLITTARIPEYWHSSLHMLPKLRARAPEPLTEIHPDTAAKYGISDGEMMVVEAKRGKIEVKARVTEDISPGIVSAVQGWKEANINLLTDGAPASPEMGMPALGSVLCRIMKKT